VLTIALPKGRLLREISRLMEAAGLPRPGRSTDRRLLLDYPGRGLRYLMVRPFDVVTYVSRDAAHLGIAGKDVLVESGGEWRELLDLGVGRCRMCLAGRKREGGWKEMLQKKGDRLRVATKFPVAAGRFLSSLGVSPEVIPLTGSVELAPLVGLSDVVVDLVSTGRTLRDNDLEEYEVIFPVTARLIAGPRSLLRRCADVDRIVRILRRAARET